MSIRARFLPLFVGAAGALVGAFHGGAKGAGEGEVEGDDEVLRTLTGAVEVREGWVDRVPGRMR